MGWVRHIAQMGEKESAEDFGWKNLKERLKARQGEKYTVKNKAK
jgi:hypothetical protein